MDISGSIFSGDNYFSISSEVKRLYSEHKFEDCLKLSQEGFAKYPDKPFFLRYLGMSAQELNNPSLALACFIHGLSFDNNDYLFLYEVASYFKKRRNIDKTIEYFKQIIFLPIAKAHAEIYTNMGILLFEWGLFSEAKLCFEKAIELNDTPYNHLGYALTLLAMKHYSHGWAEYQSRLLLGEEIYNPLKLTTPIWTGQDDLTGKTILIAWEQGLGDNIQFVRFLPLLKQKYNVRVLLTCHSSLACLFSQLQGFDELITTTSVPPHDYRIPLLSLPFVLNINDESQFMSKPYLSPTLEKVSQWKHRFVSNNNLKIGICWEGNPTYVHNARRNCPLSYFLALVLKSKATWVSLQKNVSTDVLDILVHASIQNLDKELLDFNDTLAVIHELDLVITIDSAIAHLAGATGKRTFLLLNYETEWRHPRNSAFSQWYENVKIFRQSSPGDWESAFRLLEEEIKFL